jgi:hypothetical protein
MAQSTARPEAAVDLQMVREFLERYFTIENEIKVLQQDKSRISSNPCPEVSSGIPRHHDVGSEWTRCAGNV